VPHTFAHIGQKLKHHRQERGETLAHVSNVTRIPLPYLSAIERLDEDALPSMSYALGYVRTYAKEMGLSGAAAAESFKTDVEVSHIRVHQGPKQSIKPRPLSLPKGIFSGLAVSLFAASLALWFGVHADDGVGAVFTPQSSQTYEVRQEQALPVDMYRLTAQGPSLVEIRDRDGTVLVRRIFTPGQTWEGAAQAGLTISTRNGSALTLERGGENFGPLTQFGAALPQMNFNALEFRLTAGGFMIDDLLLNEVSGGPLSAPSEVQLTQPRGADSQRPYETTRQ